MSFSEFITIDRSDVQAEGEGQMSKVKVTEVKNILPYFFKVKFNFKIKIDSILSLSAW